ncbi:MAG: DUF4296 domain-containing protein [Bacteroidales bacterium]|jgi:hypothetical protein|nr:DUF4296 domain-containing protein [Bacteroidales bacterium]
MKKILILFLFVLALDACSKDKRVSIPDEVIPPEQMVPVLVDFHLAEAALVKAREAQKDVDFLRDHYFNSILKKYNISYSKFYGSMKFYSENLKELYIIYGDVVSELSKTQSRILSRPR